MCVRVSYRVHVRRTDKVGTEAAFHPIEEYMGHVEEHYQILARRMRVDKKRVYLATDDPSLLQEAKSKYVSVLLQNLHVKCILGSICNGVRMHVCVSGTQTMNSSAITPSRGRRGCITATPRTPSEGSSSTSTSCPKPTFWSAPSPLR